MADANLQNIANKHQFEPHMMLLQCHNSFPFNVFWGTLDNAVYAENIIQPILLLFLQQEGEFFLQNDALSHDTHAIQDV